MKDRNIPEKCRDCIHCKRSIPISDFMPDWLPWEWECEINADNLKGNTYDNCPKYER